MGYFFQNRDQNTRYFPELFPEEGKLMQNKGRQCLQHLRVRERKKEGRKKGRKEGRKEGKKERERKKERQRKERKFDIKIEN